MRIGILFMGDKIRDTDGPEVISGYLAEAFHARGHDVWHASVLAWPTWRNAVQSSSDVIICHDVPASRIPTEVWASTNCMTYWLLTTSFYDADTVARTPFHLIATNSPLLHRRLLALNKPSAYIELAAPKAFLDIPVDPHYRSAVSYLGDYDYSLREQFDVLLRPALFFGLNIWGSGWENSRYSRASRGKLPLRTWVSSMLVPRQYWSLPERRKGGLASWVIASYEALLCGATVISTPSPALSRHPLAHLIRFVEQSDSVAETLANLQKCVGGRRLRQSLLKGHTYDDRALAFE